MLQSRGACVDRDDPYSPPLGRMRRYNFQLDSVEMNAESLSQYDAVLIATDHSFYDYEFVASHARLVIGTQNAIRDVKMHSEKIVYCWERLCLEVWAALSGQFGFFCKLVRVPSCRITAVSRSYSRGATMRGRTEKS